MVKPKTTAGALKTAEHWEVTHYFRDAQGQVIATYLETFAGSDCNNEYTSTMAVQEYALYGSERLGMKRSDASSQREFTGGVSTSGFSQVESDACATLQPGVNININSGSDPITITRADGEMTLTAVGDDVTITGYVNVLDGSLQNAPPNSKVLTAGDTVVFTIPTDQADIELDFGGQVILHSADNALDLAGGNPLELQALRPTHLRYAQRTLDKKDYELTDHLGNVLATISDRKTGITDSVESTVFSDNFTDGIDAWQFREAGSIQASEGQMYVNTEGEGHYAYRSVSINTGNGCNYSICLDITETEIEEGLSLVVHDGESALYTLSLTPNAQNCFENLTLPENFQLQLHASVAGSYYVDNISITKKCVEFKYYVAHVTSAKDYYPFGMVMPGRSYTGSEDYRYGFNGMEKDNEIKGDNNSLDFGARIYDPRIGKWLSLDPSSFKYPAHSPYNFSLNNPIIFNDPDGKDARLAITRNKDGGGTISYSTRVFVYGEASSDQAKAMNEIVDNMPSEYNYIDEDGKTWIVKVDVEFVQADQLEYYADAFGITSVDELRESSPEALKEIGFQDGDNLLYMGPGAIVSNDSYSGEAYVDFANVFGGKNFGIHETFHLLGLSDRYNTPGYGGDVMSLNPKTIKDIHFIDWAEYGLDKIGYGAFYKLENEPGTASTVMSGQGSVDREYHEYSDSEVAEMAESKVKEQESRKSSKQ